MSVRVQGISSVHNLGNPLRRGPTRFSAAQGDGCRRHSPPIFFSLFILSKNQTMEHPTHANQISVSICFLRALCLQFINLAKKTVCDEVQKLY